MTIQPIPPPQIAAPPPQILLEKTRNRRKAGFCKPNMHESIYIGSIDQNAFEEQHFLVSEGNRFLLETNSWLHIDLESIHFINFKTVVGGRLRKLC
jgi:hypothetical protein